jgi:DNA (cytosine-5)-methyltransferase 1
MHINKVKVKEAMENLGIKTQTQLASRLGITKNQLSVMLSENYTPLKAKAIELCQVLKIKPTEILENQFCNEDTLDYKKGSEDVFAIELFAGAGGLALGLEQAKIKTCLLVEIDKFCCETLKKNRPKWNVINEDIAMVDFSMYKGKVDIVTGGFPCQAFSYAGKKLGFDDTRGTLFHEFARCVKEVQPLIFMAENVRGLISHEKGRTLQTIVDVLSSLGYKVQYRLLNAIHYGVAQKRERVVIIGAREGVVFNYPQKSNDILTLKDVLKDCPPSEGQTYSEKKRKVLDLVPPGGCWIDLPPEIQKEYMGKSFYSGGGKRGMARRISWDEPCLTLTCSPSQKQTERCHPEETRPFTVREYARIQSFPDDWTFSGGIGEKYKQIGNAVPAELARRLGIELKKAIINYRTKNDNI